MRVQTRENAAGPIVAVVVIFGLAYAVLYCHVAGSVPWKDFSLYALNKGISLSAFILVTCGFSFRPLINLGVRLPKAWYNARKALGMTGFLLVLIHTLISFLLFRPSVYGRFFEPDGTLTVFAWLSMLCGILALVSLWAYNFSFQTFLREDRRFDRFITSQKFLQFTLLLGAVHLLILGYEDWLNPGGWQGGLPPISLLAFLIFVLGSIFNLMGRERMLT